MDAGHWSNQPRVPLGDLHDGECRAQATAFRPGLEQLARQCNVGYSRGECPRFPLEAEADAFRFNLAADQGARLEIRYIVEKSCWPVRHGELEVGLEAASGGDTLTRQAAAFAASYIRRRDQL